MGRKAIDMTGKVFSRLKVIKRVSEYAETPVKWLCLCECGKKIVAAGCDLRRGTTKSCGCLQRDMMSKRTKIHGMSKTRLHRTWGHMLERCSNPESQLWDNYGGRGIKVCDEWKEFITFYKWAMENGYDDTLSIDRIDVNGNYEPTNCRWANNYTQQNNTRVTVKVTINGITRTLSDWSKETGIPKGTLSRRYWQGLRGKELIGPNRRGKRPVKPKALQ